MNKIPHYICIQPVTHWYGSTDQNYTYTQVGDVFNEDECDFLGKDFRHNGWRKQYFIETQLPFHYTDKDLLALSLKHGMQLRKGDKEKSRSIEYDYMRKKKEQL